MGAGKKKTHHKKRVSKHILASATNSTKDKGDSSGEKNVKISESKNKYTKNPTEVASYLSSWKHREVSAWKFNKNTQSWIIRHMYDSKLVPKSTFALVTEYMAGIQGDTLRNRTRTDATRMALRYKEWEKKKVGDGGNDVQETEDSTVDNETAQWRQLDDHEKRKEYKRARQIIEALTDVSENSS